MPGAAVSHGAHKCRIARNRIRSIYFFKVEVGKATDQAGNASARRLHLDRHRDGIAIVFHDKDQRQPGISSSVQRLPELSLTGGAFAQ